MQERTEYPMSNTQFPMFNIRSALLSLNVGNWLLVIGYFALCPVSAPGGILPDGFSETRIANGLNGATAMEIAPDGRIFICEQTGTLRIVKNDRLLSQPFLTATVDSSWERGLLGVAFDPHFHQNHYLYVNYVAPAPYPHHRISRFTADGDRAVAGSEVILFEGDNQDALGGGVQNGHQGGAIHFGKDGKLYIAIGDQTAGAPAQSMTTLQGKLLRINPDGTIPEDNPFYRTTTGKYRAIWALGFRNPFTFAVQPGTGRIFVNDVGGANEEINEAVAGANYGWPTVDHGPTRDRRFRGPIHWYPESSICGGTFYNPRVQQFPSEYAGQYFFADFKQGWIKTLDPDHPEKVRLFASGLGQWSVLDLKVPADGSLYYLRRDAWVRDNDFKASTGSLYRVCYTGNRTLPYLAAELADQTAVAGMRATFRVQARGSGRLIYQWLRDDRPIPGAAGSRYTIAAASRDDDGAHFRCVVRNDFGQATSRAARLSVVDLHSTSGHGLLRGPRPGAYSGSIWVQAAEPRERAALYYTTDGSAPSPAATLYHAPFRLERSAAVRLRAFSDGKPAGVETQANFTIKGERAYGLPYRETAGRLQVPLDPEDLPPLLSQTGLFTSPAELKPAPGLVPYEVNTPLWSDGAAKRRWIALPPGGEIGFSPTGEWTFPPGTIFIKHFELPANETKPGAMRRLEIRLLVVDASGYGYGATYRWRADDQDADLLADAAREPISIRTAAASRTQTWYYPSRADCLTCHTRAARLVLGVKTRQLNRDFTYPQTGICDNQLRTWSYLGMFDRALDDRSLAHYARLTAVDDRQASLEQRARSYLDANCAHCHRPGNTIRAAFDARYDTPLAAMNLLDRPTISDSLSIRNPRVVAPGDLSRSMLTLRLSRSDNYRMPPLATSVSDQAAIAVLEEWVRNLR
jgi:uncharacterized repeat protein (TIGR03806 family)